MPTADAVYGVLVGAAVTTVDLGFIVGTVTVWNRSGTAEIFFNAGNGNVAADIADPTVAGANEEFVPAQIISMTFRVFNQGNIDAGKHTFVKLISTGTPTFAVIGG